MSSSNKNRVDAERGELMPHSKPRWIWKTKVALMLWLKHGLQWRDQYMKFGPLTAWKMAGYILEFRRSSREVGNAG